MKKLKAVDSSKQMSFDFGFYIMMFVMNEPKKMSFSSLSLR